MKYRKLLDIIFISVMKLIFWKWTFIHCCFKFQPIKREIPTKRTKFKQIIIQNFEFYSGGTIQTNRYEQVIFDLPPAYLCYNDNNQKIARNFLFQAIRNVFLFFFIRILNFIITTLLKYFPFSLLLLETHLNTENPKRKEKTFLLSRHFDDNVVKCAL